MSESEWIEDFLPELHTGPIKIGESLNYTVNVGDRVFSSISGDGTEGKVLGFLAGGNLVVFETMGQIQTRLPRNLEITRAVED